MRVKKSLATVHISNLSLETTIGWNTWEQQQKQNVIINITFDFDQTAAVESDELNDTVDYRALKNRIRREVESTSFKLLEKLADHILEVVMSDERVVSATIKVDKPHALSLADSVSVKISAERER
ncbi:MAG TPA: dihydroneopterin aldolase [Chitinispirillaceae bacterium]|jgi:FolB domain-containing protein|nr:dihydroneopterin aldolase [Chitinispirillaceae bacterium]